MKKLEENKAMKTTEFKTKVEYVEKVLNKFKENNNATGSVYLGVDGFAILLENKTPAEVRLYHFYVAKIFENASEAFIFTDANDNAITIINPPEKYQALCNDILNYFGLDFQMTIGYDW